MECLVTRSSMLQAYRYFYRLKKKCFKTQKQGFTSLEGTWHRASPSLQIAFTRCMLGPLLSVFSSCYCFILTIAMQGRWHFRHFV